MRALAACLILAVLSFSPPKGEWGDQGNGTYANPVMPADFSDLDAIRVGSDFYAISSSFQYSPGMAVLHSKDLVNWSIIGHVVPDLTRIAPDLNWDKMNREGRGIWAGAIRFHANKYWVYFGTPDEGLFMSTAAAPSGPWAPVKRVYAEAGWDDPCPFWDDNGQGYLVTTHFKEEASNAKAYNIHLFRLTPDGQALDLSSDRIIHQSKGSEANKLFKRNGTYYHFYSEVKLEGRVPMMERTHNLSGPWEIKQLLHVHPSVDKEPNQGGLVEVTPKRWFFVTHQGTGDWEGRAGVLLPVLWKDEWPIVGIPGPDGIGNMLWRADKPISGFPMTSPVTSDDFNALKLKPEWEWRYQPRADKWSLSARPGYLRLSSFRPLNNDSFQTVGNVLTQRSMRARHSRIIVKLDLSGLVSGQEAGLAHFAKTFCKLSVVQVAAARKLVLNNNGVIAAGPAISTPLLWLRSSWDFKGRSQFAYSLDGMTFQNIGVPYQLTWGSYRGDRIGLFTFNSQRESGFVDVDDFSYQVDR